jgi:ABC-type uncharacterized transport system YnjBCD substrate-binding protein
MSGVGFVTGWVSAYSGLATSLRRGPYDASAAPAAIDKALSGLKEFNQYVVMTPGNAGTLDMLNRGEIAMGPVWVDMFYTWQADGRMSPKIKLRLPPPGLPGQPMYYVIPAKAAHAQLAKKFIELAESPEVQPTASSSNSTGTRASTRSTCSPARSGGVEQALYRHLARRSRRNTGGRSRFRHTSRTSSRAMSA